MYTYLALDVNTEIDNMKKVVVKVFWPGFSSSSVEVVPR